MKIRRSMFALGLMTSALLAAPAMARDEPAQPSRAEQQERAGEVMRQMLPPEIAEGMANSRPSEGFGREMSRLAYENAYLQLWTRPGLSLKERSLVTISMLIALGNERELAIHLDSGLRNGLTPQQLEEVIYQATAYVGFPKASDALAIASEVVARERGHKDPDDR